MRTLASASLLPALVLSPLALAQEVRDTPPAPIEIGWQARNRVADPTPVRFRFGFEQTEIEPDEDFGLLGMHLDFLEPLAGWPGVWLGLGGFTAVDGQRGGFLAGGLEGGFRYPASESLTLDAGAFFGIGGGRSVPNGDGLMLRQHFGAQYQLTNRFGLRLEVSNIQFPDGDIGGQQLSLGGSWTMAPWVARNEVKAGRVFPAQQQPLSSRMRFTVGFSQLMVSDSSRDTNGAVLDEDIGLASGRADFFLDENWFLGLGAGGALTGDIDGYAQVLAGVGYSVPVGQMMALEAMLSVGGGGGGGVETGGGLLVSPSLSARVNLDPQVSAGLTVSALSAVDGDFDATGVGLDVAFSTGLPDYRPAVRGVLLPDQTALSLWVLEVMHRSYLPDDGSVRDNGRKLGNVNEMGVGLAFPLDPNFELTAQVFGAYDGVPGNYAEGWLGARYRILFPGHTSAAQWHLLLAAAGGVAGGGDISNGGGALWDARAGFGLSVSPTVGLDLTAGRTAAVDGDFEAWSLQGGLSWRFGLPVTRG